MSGSASGPLVVVGDAFLDRDLDGTVTRLAPDAPVPVVEGVLDRSRPGGAGLSAALAAAGPREVVLVAALGTDPAGDRLRELLAAAGVRLLDLGLPGETPQKVRVRADGRGLIRVDLADEVRVPGEPADATLAVLDDAAAVLVSDYGRGVSAQPRLREALARVARRVPLVWDPHPRGATPTPGVRLATPNLAELARLVPDPPGSALSAVAARARTLRERWSVTALVVTMAERGALVVMADGSPLVVPALSARSGDPCGAGDRFAATATAELAEGGLVSAAVTAAVASASAFVAAGGASQVNRSLPSPPPSAPHDEARSAVDLTAAVRAGGGTVVAAGGCFDLLHAGHVAYLQAARSLGDCLVVCLNSDSSTRRLKGPDRPLVPEQDRAAVLTSLECVDAVELFDEDTPLAALDRLRPHLFAKGGDYALADLPEAALLQSWGGQAVTLPYLDGRSTTALVKEAVRRARS